MNGTANITKQYYCPCLIPLISANFWGGFLLTILVEIDDIFVE